MTSTHLILPAALALLMACSPVRADELTPQKRADIEQLLEIGGGMRMGTQLAAAMTQPLLDELRRTRPDIPAAVLDMLPGEISAVMEANASQMQADVVPIYHRHFTAEEVRELVVFYTSPLGRKSVQVMPAIAQELMAAGRRWGQTLAPEIRRRVTEKLRQQGVKI